MVKDLVIAGAGGFGRETAWLISQVNRSLMTYRLLGFYDDQKEKGAQVDSKQILGSIDDLAKIDNSINVVIAIADPLTRKTIRNKLKGSQFGFPSIIHPNVDLGDNVIGEGCIICSGVTLTIGISIGSFSILNLNSTIGHDVVVDSFVSVMPGVNISGSVQVGSEIYIGANATLLQSIQLGRGAVIGAGAVVIHNVMEYDTVGGVPAKSIKK